MKKKKHEEHANHERWLLSYSDFMTLLMILFVVLFAMSSVDKAKFKQLSQSLKVSMGGGKSIVAKDEGVPITIDTKPVETDLTEKDEQAKLEDLKKQVDKYLGSNGMKSDVTTQIDERGLVVSLNNTLFFDTGRAEIIPESQKKLIEIGKILNQLNNYMRIEGHTDNVPIKNDQFSSNWQLSCIRAANVTELLINNCGIPPQKLYPSGYGDTRPVADNSTDEGKAKNRRVNIIIINSKFSKMESGGTKQ